MVTSFLGGFSPLRTVEDMGEGGVKKQGKSGDVLYGWSLCLIFCLFLFTSNLFTSHTLSTKAILISNITMHISRGMVLLLVLKAHFLTQACKSAVPFLQNPWDYRDSTNFFLTVGQNNFGNKILILAGILKTLPFFPRRFNNLKTKSI